MDENLSPVKPPYMSFQTFWNFIGDLSKKPLPPQIDRSLMDTKSGTDQANLTAALKVFGLIADDLTVEDRLNQLVEADEDGKKLILREMVESLYPDALQVSSTNGTEKLLHDSFREQFQLDASDTRRKAVTFFLHAARTAGIDLSPHFPQIRTGSGTPSGKSRKAGARRPRPQTLPPPSAAQGRETTPGETKVINFGEAGTVTVAVNVKWLELPANAMAELRKLIDQMNALGATTVSTEAGEEAEA